jgi:hypothetical protein
VPKMAKEMAEVSDDLMNAPLSIYGALLARRRLLLDALAANRAPSIEVEDFAAAFRSGHEARSRLLIELGTLRAKIEDLGRLHAGLGRLRPIQTTPPLLDVRL